ncbi:MAG: hypothetical protein QXF61_10170 [Nitrososphaeria archaeon]
MYEKQEYRDSELVLKKSLMQTIFNFLPKVNQVIPCETSSLGDYKPLGEPNE